MKLRRPKDERAFIPRAAEAAGSEIEQAARFFESEIHFTSADWDSAIKYMQAQRKEGAWFAFSARAAQLVILCPERRDELGLNEGVFQIMKQIILGGDDVRRRHEIAENLALLFPERKDEFRYENHLQRALKGDVLIAQQNGKWEDYGFAAVRYLILFPENRNDLELDDTHFQELQGILEKARIEKDWLSFATFAYNIMMLFPGRKEELNIDQKAQNGMLQQYQGWHGRSSAATWGSVLKIVAADRVEVTEGGIELINKDDLENSLGLPVRNLAL